MPGKFATKTTVDETQSRRDIEAIIEKYGANGFGYAHQGNKWQIRFEIVGRLVQIDFTTPTIQSIPTRTIDNRYRSQENIEAAFAQAIKQFWRAIHLWIKGKLEACELGVSTIEREFLADVVLPDGSKLGAWIQPQLAAVYQNHEMPPMLPGSKKD